MTDSISQIGRRILGQNIARSPETGGGSGSPSGVSNHSGGVDGVSSFARVDGVSGAKPTVDSKIAGCIGRIAQILTQEMVVDGESSTFSAPGVAALLMFAAKATKEGAERNNYLKTLGLDGLSLEQVSAGAEALAARLGNLDKGIAVKFANIAFSNQLKTGGFTDSFKKATAGDKVIDKPLQTEKEFADAAADMNKTISDATNGMISDFIDKDDLPGYIWSLISAIGFEGTFTNPFVHAKELIEDPGYKIRLEKEKDFGPSLLENAKRYHRKGDEEPSVEKLAAAEWQKDAAKYLEVPYLEGAQHEIIPRLQEASDAAEGRMKLATGGLKVIDNARFTAVMFPYGDQEGASFVAMMPKGNLTPKQLLADVGSAQLAAAFANAESRDSDAKDKFQLGAFKTEFKPKDFLEVLRKLAPLKFGAMIASGETAPNAARLKAVIELGPRQTKAAQVVEMAMMESAIISEPPPPIAINFDKSYAYAIVTKDDFLPIWQGTQTV